MPGRAEGKNFSHKIGKTHLPAEIHSMWKITCSCSVVRKQERNKNSKNEEWGVLYCGRCRNPRERDGQPGG